LELFNVKRGRIAARCYSAYDVASFTRSRGAFVTSIRNLSLRLSLSALVLCGAAATAQPIDPALYSAMQWRLLGPFRAGWAEMIEGVSGKPNTFYFGASGGGVWKTDDAGRTWNSLFDKGGSSAIGAIAIAPSNPDVIYIGGGQPEPRYDVQSGRAVYKSTDGGKTWTDLGLSDTKYVGRIWVSPTDPNLVVVAAVGHFFGPSDARGIYRSTDGGRTWSHPIAHGGFTGANDLASDPKNPRTLFASTWDAQQFPWMSYFKEISGPGSGVWRSDDSGAHWRRLSGGGWPAGSLGRISLAATRAGGRLRVYAVVDSKDNGGLWRSDDGGTHWKRINPGRSFSDYYFNRVTVDPRDPDVVWLTGQSIRRCDHGGANCDIFRGSPGGDDYHSIWIDPKNPAHIAEGSDQGASISVNGGRTWSDWYNQPTGQLYHLAADDRFPYWVYAGQQDSGTVAIASRSDYGQLTVRDWHPVGGDERDYDIPDPNDPNIVYGSGLGGHVSRWDARTGEVTDISPWPLSNYGARPTTVAHHFNWVNPLVASRTQPAALYLGGDVLWKSTDQGNNWSIISPDLTGKRAGATNCDGDITREAALPCGYGTIFAIEPSPHSPNEIWTGSDSGIVSITRDAGAHWTQVQLPGIQPWSKIAGIDISSLDPRTGFVAVDGHRIDDWRPHIFRTHDGGASWTEISNGLPAGQVVTAIRSDPVRPGLLYAGNETGVFVSFDDGANWQPIKQNLPTAWARDLLVHGDDLIAATQGRAIWVLGDLALLRQLQPTSASEPFHLFVPALAVRVRFNNNHDTPLTPETPVGQNPPEGAVFDYWLSTASSGPVTLDIRDGSGAVIQHFSSADAPEQLNAERYFQAGWVKPEPALATSAGAHRWVWNMRRPRPKSVEYSYSIAAVWGLDTPIDPRGQLVEPGRYTAVLTVDGKSQSVPIDIVADPRVVNADYSVARQFSESLYAPMELAWRGYAETEAVRDQLGKRIAGIHDPALLADAKAFQAKLQTAPVPNSGFGGESGTLATLETAAEGSDAAPTAALRQTAVSTIAQLNSDWAAWQQVKTADLDALNRRLAAAGLQPIAIPAEAQLNVGASGGGVDLP
jgi:photosystem II stability/assembly factor-like uncharacterized protein